jgi:hypothetical protein
MNGLRCPSCSAPRDTSDNYCRRCGHQITIDLPAVRTSASLPAERRANLQPSLLGSVAVLAVGTGLELIARRLAGNAARAAGRTLVPRAKSPPPAKVTPPSDTVTVDEVVYVRQVRLRR